MSYSGFAFKCISLMSFQFHINSGQIFFILCRQSLCFCDSHLEYKQRGHHQCLWKRLGLQIKVGYFTYTSYTTKISVSFELLILTTKKLQWNIWTHRVGHEHKLAKFLTIGTFCANNKETERLAELDNIVFTRAIYLYLLFNMSGLKICYFHQDKNISSILTLFRTTP